MNRHRLDAVSLVSGLFFAALGGLYLAGGLDVRLLRLRWLGAAALIGLGLALLLSPRPGPGIPDPDEEASAPGPEADL